VRSPSQHACGTVARGAQGPLPRSMLLSALPHLLYDPGSGNRSSWKQIWFIIASDLPGYLSDAFPRQVMVQLGKCLCLCPAAVGRGGWSQVGLSCPVTELGWLNFHKCGISMGDILASQHKELGGLYECSW